MNHITVNNLTKSFKDNTILKDISFQAHEGSVTTFLGNSGAGKTTLFRVLSGLETPDSGSIVLNGKKIGFIFQQFHLWQHMTVLENLILAPIQVLKHSKQEAIHNAQLLLSYLGLIEKQSAYPKTLSGGEQQRVAIARALMMKPDVLLFDEPTASLDPECAKLIQTIIQTLSEKNKIILIITHDHAFAKSISDHILFLSEGKLNTFSEHSYSSEYRA